MTLTITFNEAGAAKLRSLIEEGMSEEEARQEVVRYDYGRIAWAIRDAYLPDLPDFMDPEHKIEMALLPEPNGPRVLVKLDLDGECKGLFRIGEKYEVEGLPEDELRDWLAQEANDVVVPFKPKPRS